MDTPPLNFINKFHTFPHFASGSSVIVPPKEKVRKGIKKSIFRYEKCSLLGYSDSNQE